MLPDQPQEEATSAEGDLVSRWEMTAFSILSFRPFSFSQVVSGLYWNWVREFWADYSFWKCTNLLLELLESLLGLLSVVELQALLGHVLELLALELGHGLDAVLVDGLREVEHLEALLQQALHEW